MSKILNKALSAIEAEKDYEAFGNSQGQRITPQHGVIALTCEIGYSPRAKPEKSLSAYNNRMTKSYTICKHDLAEAVGPLESIARR